MSDWRNLLTLWHDLRRRAERGLLFSIVDIEGSSYRKLGAHMLIGASGEQAGTISAGCLESDLLSRLDMFFAEPLPRIVSYDNRGDDVFSLNAGCTGAICILVEDAFADGSNPLCVADKVQEQRGASIIATIIDGSPELIGNRLDRHAVEKIVAERSLTQSGVVEIAGSGDAVLRVSVELIESPLRLVIFGAQQDGRTVAQLASRTGMQVMLVDWRHQLLGNRHKQLDNIETARLHGDELAQIAADARTAFVLMSHNYDQDMAALKSLLARDLPYLGVMGPRKRTLKMLSEIDVHLDSSAISGLRFPVGLDIGADSPEEISVSIVAEVIGAFARTTAGALSEKTEAIHAPLRSTVGSRFVSSGACAQ